MPNPKQTPTYSGTNPQGNHYTRYDSGAYRYSNVDPNSGAPKSHYYDTGKGAGFYHQNNSQSGPGYSFYENHNTGDRSYRENSGGKKQ
jgi:hypothetical protein